MSAVTLIKAGGIMLWGKFHSR